MEKLKLIKVSYPSYSLTHLLTYSRRRRAGFTFIEILVVATIIGVLATIGAVSYRQANIKSRDGKRKADLEQIRAALEMCRADTGNYPLTGAFSVTSCTAQITCGGNTYLNPVPCDPKNVAPNQYTYTSCVATPCTTYTLTAVLEIDGLIYTRTNP